MEEVSEPASPGHGEVLLNVLAAGVCGSDLHTYLDGRIGDTVVGTPLIPGHECSAVITRCGPDAVDGSGAVCVPGTRVAVDPAISCGVCAPCRRDDPHLCDRIIFLGHSPVDGCFRERLLVPARNCFPIPDTITDAAGALLEPLGVALHALRLASLAGGERVAVIGTGPIGLMVIRLCVLAGASHVYAVEPLAWRRELARRWGATVAAGTNAVKDILDATGGDGVDVAIEAAWGGSAVQDAADVTRPAGKLVLVGIPGDDVLTLKHSSSRRKELAVLFSRRMKHTYPEATRLVDSGAIPVDELVSHSLPLTEGREAFSMNSSYAQGVCKVILVPSSGRR